MTKGHILNIFLTFLFSIILFNFSFYYIDKYQPKRIKVYSAKIEKEQPEYISKNPTYVIDAFDARRWAYFSFLKGSVVKVNDHKRDKWDIAFKRTSIISNGGATNPDGNVGILNLGDTDFDAVKDIPDTGYVFDKKSFWGTTTMNSAIDGWYHYNNRTHILTPNNNVYIIKTSDNKFAKMKIVRYYCGDKPACFTIEYVYPM